MAVVMKAPSPSDPAKETPTPTPSAKECAVMIPRISSALAAPAPCRSATSTSPAPESSRSATTIAPSPTSTPTSVSVMSMETPSSIRLWLAASISPAAAAFDQPIVRSPIFLTNRKGSAPTPVMIAVRRAAATTIQRAVSMVLLQKCDGPGVRRRSADQVVEASWSVTLHTVANAPRASETPVFTSRHAKPRRSLNAGISLALLETGHSLGERVRQAVPGLVEARFHVVPCVITGLANFLQRHLGLVTLLARLVKLLLIRDLRIGFGLGELCLHLVDFGIPLIDLRLGCFDIRGLVGHLGILPLRRLNMHRGFH